MKIRHRLPRWARRFAGDTKGVSAVEFALVLPLMLTLYMGGAELAQAISASRKVTLVSRTVADLAAQFATISDATMTGILDSSAAVIAPFNPSTLRVTVSQVTIAADGTATVVWSDTRGGTVRSGGATLPAALNVPNTSVIWAEAEYGHTPAVGYVLTGGEIALRDQMYMRPRMANSVTRTP
jgi:Flp pilus assembly protein TadG